jgi:hypothetical protein
MLLRKGGDMDAYSQRRLAENEVIFRQANKDAKDFLEDIGAAHSTLLPFFCECSDTDCRRRIDLSVETYEELHQSKKQFTIIPGHEVPAIEKVVKQTDLYYIVEKLTDMPDEQDVDKAIKRLTT